MRIVILKCFRTSNQSEITASLNSVKQCCIQIKLFISYVWLYFRLKWEDKSVISQCLCLSGNPWTSWSVCPCHTLVYSVLEKQGSVPPARNISNTEINYATRHWSPESDTFLNKGSEYLLFGDWIFPTYLLGMIALKSSVWYLLKHSCDTLNTMMGSDRHKGGWKQVHGPRNDPCCELRYMLSRFSCVPLCENYITRYGFSVAVGPQRWWYQSWTL